jgi:uncharacterized membrane protein
MANEHADFTNLELVVAGGLVVGTLPLFVGLALVMPILGHSTWHLCRKVVEV